MNGIQPFDFQGMPVRVIELDGELFWVARDVGGALGIADIRTTLRSFTAKEKGRHTVPTLGGEQKMVLVSEQGLYRLIFQSRKKSAKAFQTWVFAEVLPAIRKTGKYEVDSDVEDLDEDVAPRMTIPQYLKTKPTLTFDGICAFGALVRRSNQALGCSYKKECHARLGHIRSYTTDILDFAWSRFLRQNSAVRLPQLPGLEGLEIDESSVADAA